MTDKEKKYLAYMLRLWQTEHDGKLVWRASVESPYTGERQGFVDLESLVAFLEEKMGHSIGSGLQVSACNHQKIRREENELQS